jgi:hypothetical protein
MRLSTIWAHSLEDLSRHGASRLGEIGKTGQAIHCPEQRWLPHRAPDGTVFYTPCDPHVWIEAPGNPPAGVGVHALPTSPPHKPGD